MADRFETHGDFSWCELLTYDVDGAKKFYTELLGWKIEDHPTGECTGTYTILRTNGRPVGGLMKMPSVVPAGTPPHWGTYVTVDDVDAVAARVQELGGKILVPPSNSPDARFCIFQDPQGAVLSIISYSKKPE
jgi:predicted enzyme related to lactoylglutathione lyase